MPGHWRDCQEWRNQGLPLSTTNNEAAKLYDAALSQLFRYRDDPTLGGLGGTIKSMLEADPNFVMANVLNTGLAVITASKTFKNDPDLQTSLDKLVTLCKRPDVTWREKSIVDATVHWSHGRLSAAGDLLDQILVEHPTDGLAVLMTHLSHLYQGEKARHRDNLAQVVAAWKPEMPYYGYITSHLAFGFVETNYFQQAEDYAKKALTINADDSWAVHSLAHVYETTARSQNGIDFMKQHENDWKDANFLAHHNYWHWALMHIEQGDYEEALGMFDSYVKPMSLETKGLFSMADYTSLLKRLELEGVNVGERWEDVRELVRPSVEDHSLIFNDYHLLLACQGLKDTEMTSKFHDSLQEFVREGSGVVHEKMKKFGAQILQSLVAYDDGDYARAVELMNPVRYDFISLAGSNAQNDILALYLIHAALKSPESKHHKLARTLIAERQTILPGSPMVERMQAKLLALHVD